MLTTSILIVIAGTIATMITRLVPLWLPDRIKNSKIFEHLSLVLPVASFGLLVVYSLKDVAFNAFPFGLPELVSVLFIVIIQYKKDNLLLSIFSGTALYMILINFL